MTRKERVRNCGGGPRRLGTGPDAMAMKGQILVPTEPACDFALSPVLFKEKGMSTCAQSGPKPLPYPTPGSFSMAAEEAECPAV